MDGLLPKFLNAPFSLFAFHFATRFVQSVHYECVLLQGFTPVCLLPSEAYHSSANVKVKPLVTAILQTPLRGKVHSAPVREGSNRSQGCGLPIELRRNFVGNLFMNQSVFLFE